jgi:hypothetical protein
MWDEGGGIALVTSLEELTTVLLYVGPVFGIRIRRLRMFLILPDPDPLVRGMAPDPDPSLFSERCRAD